MTLQRSCTFNRVTSGNVGAGEREGRVYSELVKQKNCYLSHGMGRSGDIAANQPKVEQGSLLYRPDIYTPYYVTYLITCYHQLAIF